MLGYLTWLFHVHSMSLIHGWRHVMVGGRAFVALQSQNGDTAWMLAAENGHVDCLHMLVEGAKKKYAKNDVRMTMNQIQQYMNFLRIA
jgi:hypothetical protein